LLSSLAQGGQRTPIIVVRDTERYVLVDGYKRVRALSQLRRDTAIAVEWSMSESEALLLERLLRASDVDSAIEQGWFLREMHERFGLSQEELARRFDRTQSWVSRRIALTRSLPLSVQQHIRSGAIGAHAAMKFLVPMARANAQDCIHLADVVAPERLSNRQIGELYGLYIGGNAKTQQLVVTTPMVVLRAREEVQSVCKDKTPREQLLDDLRVVGAIARRAHGRVRDGVLAGTDPSEWPPIERACSDAFEAIESLRRRCDKEKHDVGSEHTNSHPALA
jgi:ParB/RepB/Spo0J family partition protein